MNKKAISPLIATILLIAVSIALGAIVMSWGEAYIEEKAEFVQGIEEVAIGCDAVSFNLIKVKHVPQICQKDKVIEVWFDNGPAIDIYDFQVRLLGTDDVFTAEKILKFPLAKAGSIKAEFAIPNLGKIRQLKFTPKIIVNGETKFCSDQAIKVEGINPC